MVVVEVWYKKAYMVWYKQMDFHFRFNIYTVYGWCLDLVCPSFN